MEERIKIIDQLYKDDHGIVVHAIRYEEDRQRVIFCRPGYEWEYAAPLILFRSRFKRIDK